MQVNKKERKQIYKDLVEKHAEKARNLFNWLYFSIKGSFKENLARLQKMGRCL